MLKDSSDDFKRLNGSVLGLATDGIKTTGDTSSRSSKYNNKITELNGMTFASGREAKRAQDLQLMEKAGEIYKLRYQERFELPGKVHYVADFTYYEKVNGKYVFIIEDSKGTRTREYINKAKQIKDLYGIEVRET